MGKISKSKKTLALVMALVMAFTIVPFGAWGIINASAASPEQNAASDHYAPATELRDGQQYLIVSTDPDNDGFRHAMVATDNETHNARVDDIAWTETTRLSPENERIAMWTYHAKSNGNATFYNEDMKMYLHTMNDKRTLISYGNGDDSGSWYHVEKVGGTDSNTYRIYCNARNEAGSTIGFGVNDGFPPDGFDQYSDSFHPALKNNVRLYTVANNAPDTIELPVTIRDLDSNGFLVDPYSGGAYLDALGFTYTTKDEVRLMGDQNGNAYAKFLNLCGVAEEEGTEEGKKAVVRKGLTQENLKNGKIQYSPFAVIYFAHMLRESMYFGNDRNDINEWNDDGEIPLLAANTTLSKALVNKFSRVNGEERTSGPWYHLKYEELANGSRVSIEEYLYLDTIKTLYPKLADNAAAKRDVEEFLINCDSTYADKTVANNRLTALKNAYGFTDNEIAVFKDYWYTVSHANNLTWTNITNTNPFYETGKKVFYRYCLWYYELPKYSWHDRDGYENYTENGAGFMDIAYFLMNNYFNDVKGYTSQPKEFRGIELKKVIKKDGSASYVYDSKFDTTYGSATEPIKNTSLKADNYINSNDQNFNPVDSYGLSLEGKGMFVYSAGDDLYFDFTGDDDVFLYINGKRTEVDLGGIHGPAQKRINLNDIAEAHGLKEGEAATFDFYYMERCPKGANLRMETNIQIMDASLVPQKSAYLSMDCELSEYIPTGAGVPDNTPVWYEFGVTNNGSAPVKNLVFEDKVLGVKLSGTEFILGEGLTPEQTEAIMLKNEMGMYLQKKNDEGEWVDVADHQFTNLTDAKTYLGKELKGGYRVFVYGIPYTIKADGNGVLNGVYSNFLEVTAKCPTIGGTYAPRKGSASSEIEVLEAVDKTIVVDYAGTLNYSADQLFSEDELTSTANRTVTRKMGGSANGKFGNVTLNADGSFTYAMNKNLTGTDTFTVDEAFEYPNAKMPEGSGVDHFTYNTTKTVRFVPANNVYFDDSFAGIEYGAGWSTQTGSGAALSGQGGTKLVYGNAGNEVQFTDEVHYVEGAADAKPVTAEFKFTGTGYSLYMNTTSASGNVIARVYKVNEDGTIGTKPVAMDSVVVKSAGEYKGVPVINRQGLAKDNYVVKLSVAVKGGAVAYLNGIRVYGADIEGIEYDATETNARFIEIRDNLLNGKLDAGSYGTGILYIDGSDGEANVAEYVAEGPKNEIYLKQNQGIAFKLSGALAGNDRIHVSARTLDGAATTMQAGAGEKATDIAVNSTVDMYFDVTATATDNVYVIKNTGAGTLALTNIKITNSKVEFADMAQATAEQAIALFSMAAPVEPEVPETPTEPETPVVPQNPFEKFFNDIKDFFNKLFGIK